jgi:uncharacterized membrane protein YgcG
VTVAVAAFFTGWGVRSVPVAAAGVPPIDDEVGVVDAAGEARVLVAIERLREEDGVGLFVVYVRTFGGVPPEAWAERLAIADGLGAQDVLLALAVDDLQYGYSIGATVPVGDATLARLAERALVPTMTDGAWADAAVDLAAAYRDAIGGGDGVPPWAVATGLVVLVGAAGARGRARARRRRSDPSGLTSVP